MANIFEENLKCSLESLRESDFPAATARLYRVSKSLAIFQLDTASDTDVAQFAKWMGDVVTMQAEKAEEVATNRTDLEGFRFMLTDTYRILRNSCAANQRVQIQLGGPQQGPRLVTSSGIIAETVQGLFKGESLVQVLAVIIQFLYNLCVNVEANQDLVWDHFKTKLRKFLDMAKTANQGDQELSVKILNVTCAVVEVCLPRTWERSERFLDDYDSLDIMKTAIQASTAFNFEFRRKVMMKVVQVPNLLLRLMNDLNFRERECVYIYLKEAINEWRESDEKEPESAPKIQSALQYLAEAVIMARPLLTANRLAQPGECYEPDLVAHTQMLDVLGVASCCKVLAPHLSSVVVRRYDEPRNLVDYAIGFLKDINEVGKSGPNMLSVARSTEQVDYHHPAFQLRKFLVRLIGNLAHENKAVQDQVRQYEDCSGLAVMLEQTVVDERNPFLPEWTKLALSNLVQGNEESARYISSITKQGRIDAKRILEDCGLVVEADGERIKIRAEGPQPSLRELSQKDMVRP
ncbi:hypothetical protein ACOMHN_057867 [Nucella lapillus]